MLGGFDQARFHPSKLSLPIGGFNDQNLPVSIESIVAENTLAGIVSMHPNGKAIEVTGHGVRTVVSDSVRPLGLGPATKILCFTRLTQGM